eukprot:6605096-Prymnesium_polylepis.1
MRVSKQRGAQARAHKCGRGQKSRASGGERCRRAWGHDSRAWRSGCRALYARGSGTVSAIGVCMWGGVCGALSRRGGLRVETRPPTPPTVAIGCGVGRGAAHCMRRGGRRRPRASCRRSTAARSHTSRAPPARHQR